VDNVKIRLHRARETLKESLERGCDFHRDQEDEFGCELKDSDMREEERGKGKE